MSKKSSAKALLAELMQFFYIYIYIGAYIYVFETKKICGRKEGSAKTRTNLKTENLRFYI